MMMMMLSKPCQPAGTDDIDHGGSREQILGSIFAGVRGSFLIIHYILKLVSTFK